MNDAEVMELIQILRESGNDNYRVEAKDASSGIPRSLDATFSAFGNMPEGGLILLGVAEQGGTFEVTGVSDAKAALDALGSKARQKIVPPLQLGAVDTHLIDGKTVISCVIPPQPNQFKPFKVGSFGPAYTRAADGDYRLSPQEEQYLVGLGGQPFYDRMPVAGASVEKDLAPDLVDQYLDVYLKGSVRLRNSSRDEQLLRSNVVANDSGEPTLAAIYALGVHPQQFLPHLSVKVHVKPENPDVTALRLIDADQFYGPVPDLLSQSFEWVNKQLRTAVVFEDGQGRDLPELPAVAIRELIANALVHRDLSSASFGTYVQVVKTATKLIISSPGGLWGITQRQLGSTSPRARNPVLYAMCSAIKTSDDKRVIEGHATGIPATRRALSQAFLPEPYFKDGVIRFQAVLSSATVLSSEQMRWLGGLAGAGTLSVAQKHALVRMKAGQAMTNSSYREFFPMDSVHARNELQELVQFGLAKTVGSGRATEYLLNEAVQAADELNKLISEPDGAKEAQEAKVQDLEHVRREREEDDTAGLVHPVSPVNRVNPVNPGRFKRLTMAERQGQILVALKAAGEPLSKEQLRQVTGFTPGQITPAIQTMLKEGTIRFTEPQRSRFQRYAIA
ncbi:ATP-binding protein [Corynebacterium kozikiae]|uniref:ATP-binding protein n=1 Tax=Corynebacterium kozikiae TaxID=2968469 RepID=UPI00211BB634|nr:ATP-binding protein [Corynebacterium sp. 76QC2CO]MCQ9343244.1 putative DNA binding domain-containing protein [Corynebacterium sp. 76QC2CO]